MCARLRIALWGTAAILGWSCTIGAVAEAVEPGTAAHKQVLSELHQAKHLLDHANHNYNGHRAHADHEINKAIHILHPNHHHKATTTVKAKAPAAKHKAVHEPQQASDTQLRQAEKLVRAALLELHKHHGEKAHAASKHLHHAIHEIELAIHAHHKHHNKNQAVVKN